MRRTLASLASVAACHQAQRTAQLPVLTLDAIERRELPRFGGLHADRCWLDECQDPPVTAEEEEAWRELEARQPA